MSEMELKSFLINNNPVHRLAPLAEADIPIFHVHGEMDDRVPLKQNSLELTRRYLRLGGKAELLIIPGRGHEVIPEFFKCRKLVDFIIRHAE
jgi:dipeptidyl aminopeptidase/acylaminoacyl peptidase